MQQVERAVRSEYVDLRGGIQVAQRQWAGMPLRLRVGVIAELRRRMASGARELAETVPTSLPGALHRTVADTLVAEVLPLIEACRFLEREAVRILRTKRLGRRGRPLWLGGVEAQVERAPLGIVLVVGAANYPLFLAGVQTIQALTAGNAVFWKPAPGTANVAFALRTLLLECGLQPQLLTLLDPVAESASEAIAAGVDHVVLTGSAETGKAVLRQLAETLIPATMELSGCDAVFVLPGADFEHTVKALVFGLRFNGSFTCMAPRRVFLVGLGEAEAAEIETRMAAAMEELAAVPIPAKTETRLRELMKDARSQEAEVVLDGLGTGGGFTRATLILSATPALLAMRTDIFAPVLSVMRTADVDEALAASAACPYALTAAVFGPEVSARAMASKLLAGNVLINDVVIPTADPRIPFGGRGRSGFGVTRGAEGLLAMTSPRTVQVQRRRNKRPYEATGEGQIELFAGLAEALHGNGIRRRLAGLKRVLKAARKGTKGPV
jgi:acyl-CoA reductase-like NAD-dependent aldehyde dehydrogenase